MVPQHVENFCGFRTRRVINGQRHQSLIRTQALDPEDRLRLERLQGSSQPSLVQPMTPATGCRGNHAENRGMVMAGHGA